MSPKPQSLKKKQRVLLAASILHKELKARESKRNGETECLALTRFRAERTGLLRGRGLSHHNNN